uniref:Uncharacterized protein n=1 Tax=Sarcophilus harrisii TaxID=9305 RepID=A0A7N4V5A9_SARHA
MMLPSPAPAALAEVQLLVLRQVGLVAEALAAARALVRLVPGVDAAVADEVRALDEALAALGAGVGLLAGVRALVLRERGEVAEALLALAAAEGLLAGVHAEVVHQVRVPAEALAALAAHVRALARVRALVREEVGADAEGLPALGARIRLLPGVQAAVLEQVGAPAEALAAVRTQVGPLPRVQAQVVGQVRVAAEALAALPASVRLLPRGPGQHGAPQPHHAHHAPTLRGEAVRLDPRRRRLGQLVHALVLKEGRSRAEALAAIGADGGGFHDAGHQAIELPEIHSHRVMEMMETALGRLALPGTLPYGEASPPGQRRSILLLLRAALAGALVLLSGTLRQALRLTQPREHPHLHHFGILPVIFVFLPEGCLFFLTEESLIC